MSFRLSCGVFFSVACFVMPSLVTQAYAVNVNLKQQRALYTEARTALARKDLKTFHARADRLTDYPLYPYLRYEFLRKNLSSASDSEVRKFLDESSYIPASNRLRSAWLKRLAKKKHWKTYLRNFQETKNVAQNCNYLHAKISTSVVDDALLQKIQERWLVGKSQPNECDPVFAWYERQGYLTPELIWKRIDLAMAKRDVGLANYLAKKLPSNEAASFAVWKQVDALPSLVNVLSELREDNRVNRSIVAHGLRRLARRDVNVAYDTWFEMSPRYQFEQKEKNAIEADVALVAAYRHDPSATSLMYALPAEIEDVKVQQWRARAALREQDWGMLLRSIALLDEETKEALEWRYWRARALEETGLHEEAKVIFAELASERDYHGFLAADRMQQPYAFAHQALNFSDTNLQLLLSRPALIRARELYHVGQVYEARREWAQFIGSLDQSQLRVAAYIAHEWGWHHKAIVTVAKGRYYHDLDMRFPMPVTRHVKRAANQFTLEPAWIYGVIRQESAFLPNARSHAGARGLMQLMPATARQVAKQLNKPRPKVHHLGQPSLNIELGSGYLRSMMNKYNRHQVLATAAYNAGPHRVTRWLPRKEKMAADVWVDTIPFTETRNYVRKVMAYTAVYEWKMEDQAVTRLQSRMPPVFTTPPRG